MKTLDFAITLTVAATLVLGLVYFAKNKADVFAAPKTEAVTAQKIQGESTKSAVANQATKSASVTESVPTLASGYCLNVPALMYHHIEPQQKAKEEGHTALNVDSGVFENQMAYLSQKGYTAVTADQLAQALKSRQGLPPKSIVLTFDDGYSDFYTYAFPIIKKYGFKANLMIPTGLIENSGYMTWEQLKEIASSGSGNIYNHTWSHASLGSASIEKITYEVETSQGQLEKYLGKRPNIFTYPYGTVGQTVITYLASNGFTAAFSEIQGTYQCDSYLMTLHRTRVGNLQLSTYGI